MCWPFRCCPERSKCGGGGSAGPAIVSTWNQRGSFQKKKNICLSLVTCASLKCKKIKLSDSDCQVNDVLMLSWIATRLCRDTVRFEAAWLGRSREGADWPPGHWLRFSRFIKNTEEKKVSPPRKRHFWGTCPTLGSVPIIQYFFVI